MDSALEANAIQFYRVGGISVPCCPVEPSNEGYYGTDEWRREYPAVLRAYYGMFGQLGGRRVRCGDLSWCDRGVQLVGGSDSERCNSESRRFRCLGDGNECHIGNSQTAGCSRCIGGATGFIACAHGLGVSKAANVQEADGGCSGENGGGSGFGIGASSDGAQHGAHGAGAGKERKGADEVVSSVVAGSSESTVSARTLSNRLKREKKKTRKVRKQQNEILEAEMRRIDGVVGREPKNGRDKVDGSVQQRVDDSVKEKWILRNKLETMELERKIKLLQNTRVEDDIKAANLKVRAAIERQMVGIEKTHSKLAASDCVPVDDLTEAERSSRVHTLQSGVSPDTISPNSSASMAEFRAVQKKNLDLEKVVEKLREMLEKCGIDRVRQEIAAKSEWTCDENMCLTEENEKLICQTDIGYVGPLDGPHLCDDGKYRMELDLYDDRERVMYIDPFGAN